MHQALIVLQKGVAQCFPDDQPLTDPRSLQTKGKAMLLVGRFMEETANFESNAIMKAYKVKTMISVEEREPLCKKNLSRWKNLMVIFQNVLTFYRPVR